MAEVETKKDFGEGAGGTVGRWLAEIKAYDKTFETWTERSQEIVRRYRDEQESQESELRDKRNRFNILWSNVETLKPAIYSRDPEPDITRRHNDKDKTARASAIILEQASRTEIEDSGFGSAMRAARDDYLLTARGQVWVRYVPTYGEETKDKIFLQVDTDEEGNAFYRNDDGEAVDEPEIDEDGSPYQEGEPYRPVVSECTKVEHIAWSDFGHTPAPNWSKVRAVWKREQLTRDQLNERFGAEIGQKVGMNRAVPNVADKDKEAYGDTFKRAEVYEIWDKTTGKVLWVSPGYTEGPLDEIDDPLGLEAFFPCPEPLYGTKTTDSLVPVPDYTEYRTQAEEIDTLTQRISLLLKALRVAGAYNSEFQELQKLLDGGDNVLVPVDPWAAFAEKGGVEGAISFLPIKEIAAVVTSLVEAREQMKQDLYEITGISDIVRGQTDPRETRGAQEIKQQFAGMRIQDRQDAMARFAQQTVRIMAEVMAEQFSPETLFEMSGWQHTEEAQALDAAVQQWAQAAAQLRQQGQAQQFQQMAQNRPLSSGETFQAAVEMLRSDRVRGYRIEIETDSMVLEDRQREQRSRMEFIEAATGFLQQAVPAIQQHPALAALLSEMLMFGIRGFKAGRPLEEAFEQAMEEMGNQPAPQQEGEGDGQADQMKAQVEAQKLQVQSQEAQAKAQIEAQKLQLERQAQAFEQQMKQRELEAERAAAQREHELNVMKLKLDEMKIMVQAGDSETRARLEEMKIDESRAARQQQGREGSAAA